MIDHHLVIFNIDKYRHYYFFFPVSDVEAVLPSIDELLEHEDMECYHGDAEFRCKLMVIYEHARRMNM